MSVLGEDVMAMARASANEEELVGIEKRWYIRGFIKGFLGTFVKLLHHVMKHFDKSYDEAALHLTLSPAETEFYRPLVQAYVSDQELYQTLLSETITTIMYGGAGEVVGTEND